MKLNPHQVTRQMRVGYEAFLALLGCLFLYSSGAPAWAYILLLHLHTRASALIVQLDTAGLAKTVSDRIPQIVRHQHDPNLTFGDLKLAQDLGLDITKERT